MNQTAKVNYYQDRFDLNYLKLLYDQLDPKMLTETAIPRSKKIDGIEYKHCIRINFSGLAASLLFALNLSKVKDDKVRTAISRIYERLQSIFSKEMLKKFNEHKKRCYVKASFCFSYLYSDYAICLMKAEVENVWEYQVRDDVNDFYPNMPLSMDEFTISPIHNSQSETLRQISELVSKNRDIVMGNSNEVPNTIQVRFAPIPVPQSIIMINNLASSQPYFYVKPEGGYSLELKHPVTVLDNLCEADKSGYFVIEKNFYYLWKHDLTLFCSDVTKFRRDHPAGLATVLPPVDKDDNSLITWEQKIQRMKEKIIRDKKPMPDDDKIKRWKDNVSMKLSMCTRPIMDIEHDSSVKKAQTPENGDTMFKPENISIKIEVLNGNLSWCIQLKDMDVICRKKEPDRKGDLLFCVLAHYGYAKKYSTDLKPLKPDLFENCAYYKDNKRNKIYSQLTGILQRNLTGNYDVKLLFDALFSTQNKQNLTLLTFPKNIYLDQKDLNLINEAEYVISKAPGKKSDKKGCLADWLE